MDTWVLSNRLDLPRMSQQAQGVAAGACVCNNPVGNAVVFTNGFDDFDEQKMASRRFTALAGLHRHAVQRPNSHYLVKAGALPCTNRAFMS